jgi:hypothetical protein
MPPTGVEKMKIVTFAAAAVLAAGVATAAHASCDEDTIESANNGILVMQSGHVYEARFSSDTVGWMGLDDVLICGDQMVNKDENGETADITKLD